MIWRARKRRWRLAGRQNNIQINKDKQTKRRTGGQSLSLSPVVAGGHV